MPKVPKRQRNSSPKNTFPGAITTTWMEQWEPHSNATASLWGVLIDAQGTIRFYAAGYETKDLQSAISKLGPEFGSLAVASANAH